MAQVCPAARLKHLWQRDFLADWKKIAYKSK
jgi:hypothetical protein